MRSWRKLEGKQQQLSEPAAAAAIPEDTDAVTANSLGGGMKGAAAAARGAQPQQQGMEEHLTTGPLVDANPVYNKSVKNES